MTALILCCLCGNYNEDIMGVLRVREDFFNLQWHIQRRRSWESEPFLLGVHANAQQFRT